MASTVKAVVIRCSKAQVVAGFIYTYLRIKARLASASSVVLAVEDAGTYKFYLLRDLFYFKNIANNKLTDKPFTLQWKETPELVTLEQMSKLERDAVAIYLNSPEGLDAGYTISNLNSDLNVQLPYCQRFYVNPESTAPRTALKKIPDRNPFLRNATVGEIVREMQRRGYHVHYSTEQEKEDQCSPS